MLGRVRASPVSSLELEMEERPPSKITKQDSLSIYEATLLKLRQGARRVPSMDEESTMEIDADDVATIPVHTDSSSDSSTIKGKSMSILYFFSKCKGSPHGHGSDGEEPVSGYNSSSSVSTASVDSS